MSTLVDDVGSFPLPTYTDGKLFEEAYQAARRSIIAGKTLQQDEVLTDTFRRIVIGSFMKKVDAGLDIVNYPQHYDMQRQVADALRESMNEGTYAVKPERAVLPEVHVIEGEAKRLYEDRGQKVRLRVCIMGPVELYLREMGTIIHKDVLQAFAENARRFARKSILKSKYVETEVVSLDEPSFGFQDVLTDRETVLAAIESAFNFGGVMRQIHVHSPSRINELLNVHNIDVVSIEYAASPKNIESVSRQMLDQADKQIRVGVSRTDINSILAELYERGVTKPEAEQMVEEENVIRKRYETAKAKYGDRMSFTGPDCGLGGWPTQEAAQLLLTRTVKAVGEARTGEP